MDLVLVQILNGLQYGLLIFLAASGLTLIFGIMGIINLSHGSFYMLGAYLSLTLTSLTGDIFLSLALGIPLVAMLSVIVFVCSFLPVVGVVASLIPIALVALNAGGLYLSFTAVWVLVVLHAAEAYLLNPWIYGRHLKLNPVLTLIILYVAYHAFGLWGMLLGVPVARYFIHDVLGIGLRDAAVAPAQ